MVEDRVLFDFSKKIKVPYKYKTRKIIILSLRNLKLYTTYQKYRQQMKVVCKIQLNNAVKF